MLRKKLRILLGAAALTLAASVAAHDPNTTFGATFAIDADSSFTNRAKVHANK